MRALSRHGKALTVALMLATAAALVSFALAYPKPVSHPLLGSDWRCSRTAFLTSCTRIERSKPVYSSHIEPMALPRT